MVYKKHIRKRQKGRSASSECKRAHLTFKIRWLKRFGLETNWREAARAHLETLCFSTIEETIPLIEALFETVPDRLKNSPGLINVAEAYGWCCFSFWQCQSAFPAFPEKYARFLLDHLLGPGGHDDRITLLLASLFTGADDPAEWSGINHPELRNPEVIRTHEWVVRDGLYEVILDAPEKYDEFELLIRGSAELKHEWLAIKAAFSAQVAGRTIIHRSLVPERNWVRGIGAESRGHKAGPDSARCTI